MTDSMREVLAVSEKAVALFRDVGSFQTAPEVDKYTGYPQQCLLHAADLIDGLVKIIRDQQAILDKIPGVQP